MYGYVYPKCQWRNCIEFLLPAPALGGTVMLYAEGRGIFRFWLKITKPKQFFFFLCVCVCGLTCMD